MSMVFQDVGRLMSGPERHGGMMGKDCQGVCLLDRAEHGECGEESG